MHRLISTFATIVLGLGCFAATTHAANISDNVIGISIDLDDELVEKSDGYGNRFFSAPDNSAAVYIIPVWDLNLYDLGQELDDGKWKGYGMKLDVGDDKETAGVESGHGMLVPINGRIGEYKVTGIFGAYTGYDDQNFLVIGAARPDYWRDWKDRIEAMFESISFIKVDYSQMMQDWQYRIVGMSLVPKDPVVPAGFTARPINLCSDGTLAHKETQDARPTQQTIWNGYAWVTAVVPPPPPVRWSIAPVRGKPKLLIHNGPSTQEFLLDMDGDQLLLSGKPYTMKENALCQ